MFRVLLLSLGALLTACSMYSRYKEPGPIDGHWRVVEMVCEKGDYTKAGKKLHEYYEAPTVRRIMYVERDVMQTVITQKENKELGHKDCTTKIKTPFTVNGHTLTARTNVVKKESDSNPDCKGERTIKKENVATYELDGSVLKMKRTGNISRINEKNPERVCKASPFVIVFEKILDGNFL